MELQMVTWAALVLKGSPPVCEAETVTEELDGLLTAHVANLMGRMEEGSTPDAEFINMQSRARFERISAGADFIATATEMAKELQDRMDLRMRPRSGTGVGLFVAARLVDDGSSMGAVFKLDVTDRYAGSLRRRGGSGRAVLAAVRDLLETPGRLQKGAVWPDSRTSSEVVVGDKMPDTALYFLDAMGIRQVQRPSEAPREVIAVVTKHTTRDPDDVARAMYTSTATTPASFVDGLQVNAEERRKILQDLEERRRPVRSLDSRAARSLKKTIRGSGLTITGPVTEVAKRVTIDERPEGGWQMTILFDDRPEVTFD